MRINRVTLLLSLIVLCFGTSSALAAAKSWFVTKDKRGICKVIKAKTRTSATISGPFATKREALESKEKECAGPMRPRKPARKPVQPESSSQTGETNMQPTGPGQQGPPSDR
jgi:hypothetical protein